MAIFTNEFIAAEINNLDLIADTDKQLDAVRKAAEDFFINDKFTYGEVMKHIDKVILNANLREIN